MHGKMSKDMPKHKDMGMEPSVKDAAVSRVFASDRKKECGMSPKHKSARNKPPGNPGY